LPNDDEMAFSDDKRNVLRFGTIES
jgi:hypothetical protein